MMFRPGLRIRRRRFLLGTATVLLVGGAAYKLGQSQAQQVQQHTGKPPEDLSQEELEQAMDDLGIEEQEITPQEMQQIESMAQSEQPAAAAAAPAPPSDYITELQQLAGLRDQGIITEEEFQAKKKQLLGV
jgi:hypothetical protein